MASASGWRLLIAMGAVALILLAVAWLRLSPFQGDPDTVSVHVPGAMNLAVYCGGATHFADGEWIEFAPEGKECEIEGPLSAVMPVRGRFVLDGSPHYRCTRQAMEYKCSSSK